MPLDREYMGPAVQDGLVRFFSVSALEKADSRSGGCMRSYYYRYVLRIKETKESEAIKSGKALDEELTGPTGYLRTGNRHLSALALTGLHILPDPGADLLVQQSIGSPSNPLVTAAGVALIGKLDIAHCRGTNKGGSDILDTIDPPGTAEVIDIKWKRDGARTEYQLEPNQLVQQIQMAGYAKFITHPSVFPSAQRVRLSHAMFFSTRGKPRKVTKLHLIEEPLRTWEYVEGLARTIKDVARETDVERVDANIHACGKYGGCQHREYCTAYKRAFADQSSATLFGETLSKEIGNAMGLMTSIPGMAPVPVQTQQPAPVAMQQPTPVAMQQPTPVATIDLRAQLKAQLEAEEQRLRAQTVVQNAAVTLDFATAWKVIEASGRGYPVLGGQAAVQRAALMAQTIPAGAALSGAGELGAIRMDDPAHVIQLGTELSAPPPVQHVQRMDPMPSTLPPDAPASNPALAAQPMPGYSIPGANYSGALVPAPLQVNSAQQTFAQAPAPGTPPPAAPKRRGRPPKVAAAPMNIVSPGNSAMVTNTQAAVQNAQVADDSAELEVYVDCVPLGEYESLQPYVEHLLGVLCEKFIPKEGLKDVRCAPRESALGYGGWKGAVRAIVIEQPPQDAVYHIDTRGSEVNEVVADAMLAVCAARDARYARGVR